MHGDDDVAIFWDYENCHTATHINGYEIVKKIQKIAHNYGSIKLFKAYLELSEPVAYSKSLNLRSELQLSGVSLTDTPHNGRKEVADKMILVDMLAYAIDNPQPTTIILISGDRDFAYAVSILRSRRYRVVIISPGGVHISLRAQASAFLDWSTDVLCAEPAEQTLLSNNVSRPQMVPPNVTLPGHYVCEESNCDMPRVRSSNRNHSDTRGFIYGDPVCRAPSTTEFNPPVIPLSPISKDVMSETSNPSTKLISISPKAGTSVNAELVQEAVKIPQDTRNDDLGPGQHASHLHASRDTKTASRAILNDIVQPTMFDVAPSVDTTPAVAKFASIDAYSIPTIIKELKIVPPNFKLLVERLEFHRSKGVAHILRSDIALELAARDDMLYRRAGTTKFKHYIALAQKAGIIELGGKDLEAWIALHPNWCGTGSNSQ